MKNGCKNNQGKAEQFILLRLGENLIIRRGRYCGVVFDFYNDGDEDFALATIHGA